MEELSSLARMYQQELKKWVFPKLFANSSYESGVVCCHGQFLSYGAAAMENLLIGQRKNLMLK
ncbi:hypothetical protein, partial [Kingella kingae]|uniref:hypothetical protein n=1 Tax=Kingella kingae TaxID=504 RepID=UPI001E2D771E